MAGDTIAQFGVMQVKMEWTRREFVNPSWGQWIPDSQLSDEDSMFYSLLSGSAAVGAEAFMREEIVKKGKLTPKKEEIYNEYQKRIVANGDRTRFNLRLSKI